MRFFNQNEMIKVPNTCARLLHYYVQVWNKILKFGSNLLTIIPFFLLQGCIKLHMVPSESH